MNVFDFITLFGGLAMFLYGMEIMGGGLKKSSGVAIKKVLGKLTHNVVFGVLTGMLVTAVIQSSTATIVLTVGLIGAGLLNLKQAASIVMGANIGTTVTAQMIRLMDIDSSGNAVLEVFKPSTLAPASLIVGIMLLMFFKRSRVKNAGEIFVGFGVLFSGLMSMTNSVSGLENSQVFADMMREFADIPVLGIVIGLVITVIIQSSSATVGILQALSSTGAISFSLVYPVIMGINLGTCVTTAMVCSIGTGKDAKRTGVVHILFNVFGTVVFMIGMTVFRYSGLFPDLWTKTVNSGDIANFQTLFNLVTAVLLVPCVNLLVKMSKKIVKDDPVKPKYAALKVLDDNLFVSPDIAVSEAEKGIAAMGKMAVASLCESFALLHSYSDTTAAEILETEDQIDAFTDMCDNFLVRLSKHTKSNAQNRSVNRLMQINTDFERIGDYATNILEHARDIKEQGITFSGQALSELDLICGAVKEILDLTVGAVETGDIMSAQRVEPLEEVIDDMTALLKDRHIERLKAGKCTVGAGIIFVETLTYLERASDQCSSVALLMLARDNEEIMANHHQYLRELHKGSKQEYSDELARRREQYMEPLIKLEDSAG